MIKAEYIYYDDGRRLGGAEIPENAILDRDTDRVMNALCIDPSEKVQMIRVEPFDRSQYDWLEDFNLKKNEGVWGMRFDD